MPELIILERIDGNPVAWRCSHCRQRFSAVGKLTTQERLRKITAEFKTHMEQNHNDQGFDHATQATQIPQTGTDSFSKRTSAQ